jgi:hypothetical protein
LDLPISKSLLDRHFKLFTIKRSWEDQLELKSKLKNNLLFILYCFVHFLGDDFVSDCDLHVACVILQKQIEYIDGEKENIVIPRLRMKYIRESEDKESKFFR